MSETSEQRLARQMAELMALREGRLADPPKSPKSPRQPSGPMVQTPHRSVNNQMTGLVTGDILEHTKSGHIYMYLGTSTAAGQAGQNVFINITADKKDGHMQAPDLLDSSNQLALRIIDDPVDFVRNNNTSHKKNLITITRIGNISWGTNIDNAKLVKITVRFNLIISNYIGPEAVLRAAGLYMRNTVKKAEYLCPMLHVFGGLCNPEGGAKTRRNRRSSRKTKRSKRRN